MVADNQCTPPKKIAKAYQKFNQINKNKSLAETLKAQAALQSNNLTANDSEFKQPAPLKA